MYVFYVCVPHAFKLVQFPLEIRYSWTKFNSNTLIARDRQSALQLLVLLTSTNILPVLLLLHFIYCPCKSATKFISRQHIPVHFTAVIRNEKGSTLLSDPSPTSNYYKLISTLSREVCIQPHARHSSHFRSLQQSYC